MSIKLMNILNPKSTTIDAPALTPEDQELLYDLEAKVEESGTALCVNLAKIHSYKEGIFWKQDYAFFHQYVLARFGYREQHAGRLLATGLFFVELENSSDQPHYPVCESHVRELVNKLPPNHRGACWRKITKSKEPCELTGKIVRDEVAEYRKIIPVEELELAKPPRKPKKSTVPENKITAATEARQLLAKLKIITAQLPESEAILDLLDSIDELIAGNE